MRNAHWALLLLFSSVASSQPLEEPWTVAEAEGGIRNPQICLRNSDTADVFYQIADTVFHSTVELSSGVITAGPTAFENPGNWHRRLCIAIASDDKWRALVFDSTSTNNRTLLMGGSDAPDSIIQLHEGINTAWPNIRASSITCSHTLCRRFEGGLISAWLNNWSWEGSFNEAGSALETKMFDPHLGTATEDAGETGVNGFEGEFRCYVLPSLPADSVTILLSRSSGELYAYRAFDGESWNMTLVASLDCGGMARAAMVTHEQRVFVLVEHGEDETARLVELPGLSSCLDVLILDSEPLAAASNPDFGLAWLSRPLSGLLLYRADTTGAEYLAAGTVHWPQADHTIMEAAIGMSGGGRIAALWSEGVSGGTEAAVLKIASLGWDTPLAADEHRFAPQPLAFSLSAFPNPFNSELRIQYLLKRTEQVELAAYDVLGRKAAVIESGDRTAGVHTARWIPGGAGGIYFLRLTAGSEARTEKIVYLR